ncbi:hypothetical protein KY290_032974 [Solanum tuberosum]|uniref:Helicase C-terminal domain-containing protein n=1 Tax=Solanum tuberosum TaxID=4113 RepID=A0ABQ7UDI9_SOLTU|nr:hypothetical protein KY289_032364 [Solanum tuberosum]KAH0744981.1 hypothetical protein KY290_032974 [Solanum tuberosum]
MSIAARDASVNRFNEDSDCRILLMSLKSGGVALNLTVASHVFLMDPWWNPVVDQQAQDRIHRIGQYKPVKIVKFVIENTIEEKILELQEKKKLLFEGHDNCWFFRGLRKANKRGLDIPVLLSLIDICIVQLLAKFCTKDTKEKEILEDDREYDYYNTLKPSTVRYVQAGTLRNNYGHIFAMITRLRKGAFANLIFLLSLLCIVNVVPLHFAIALSLPLSS